METQALQDFKTAILRELADAGKALNKFNLIGRNPAARGPLEHRLGITFDKDQRAQAGQAFEELKREGLIRPTYTDLIDPENWLEITEAGQRALKIGLPESNIDLALGDSLSGAGLSKFGIPDHISFGDRLSSLTGTEDPVSVLFLDLDNFKSVNDEYDHATGDQVIREATGIIRAILENKGELFHRSGDEFIVLLQNYDTSEATGVGERIRKTVEHHSFPIIGTGVITMSVGLATYPFDGPTLEEIERLADRAAMRAKKLGRNRVVECSELNSPIPDEEEDSLTRDRCLLQAIADQLPYAKTFTDSLNLVLMLEKIGLACSETDRAREIFGGLRREVNWSIRGGLRVIDYDKVRSYLLRECSENT